MEHVPLDNYMAIKKSNFRFNILNILLLHAYENTSLKNVLKNSYWHSQDWKSIGIIFLDMCRDLSGIPFYKSY